MTDLAPRQLVLRFLASIGRPAEAEQYLELFRREAGRFAILHVSHAVVRDAGDALIVDLRFLAELGLAPVIVLGAERARNADVRAARLAAALPPRVAATVAAPAPAAVRAELEAGRLPIVALTQPDGDTRAALDRRFDAIAELAAALGTHKIVFVGRRSGLQPTDGRVVSLVDLTTDKPALLEPGVLPGPQAELLRQIGRIVDAVPHRTTVSVTSPLDLLRELFTVKGAGTLVRRGSIVVRHAGGAGVDDARLIALVEGAFGRRLVGGFTERPVRAVYVADDYRGAAVVTDTPLAPYLSKFAVTLEARGEGVGRDLWRAMDADLPRLYWRSQAQNPITAWYREQCDGLQRLGDWVVLWRGLSADEIPAAIAHCAATPADFA
jgi:bifunctional N-acetylglutamate synthase/kinase